MFMNENVWNLKVDLGQQDDVKDRAYTFFMVFSILGLVIGVAGCMVLLIQSRIYYACLSISLSVTWVFIALFGAILVLASTVGETMVTEVCDQIQTTKEESKEIQADVGKKQQLQGEV